MAVLVFQHGPHTGIQRLGVALRDHGHTFDIVELHRGDPLPPDLDDVHGIVATGGSTLDEEPGWLDDELHLLRQAHERSLPVLGICLGSQLLARALGGSVGPVEGGIRLGWHPVRLTEAGKIDPLHAGVPWHTQQFHWNRHTVTELPPDAVDLARSPHGDVQTWRLGLRTYGIQHHPEIHRDAIPRWLADDPEALEQAGLTREQLDEQTEAHFAAFQRVTDRQFELIALLLMPVDRRFAGIAKDLHH